MFTDAQNFQHVLNFPKVNNVSKVSFGLKTIGLDKMGLSERHPSANWAFYFGH